MKLFGRMKTADTSPLLSLGSSVYMSHDQINPHICNALFYKAVNKLHYHTIEISEFQLVRKYISSVPSILQITAPKLCSIPQFPAVLIFLPCFNEHFTSYTFLHRNKMNIVQGFKSWENEKIISPFPSIFFFLIHWLFHVLAETMMYSSDCC